jgi:hypothetical protein
MDDRTPLDQYTTIPRRDPSENGSLISALRQLNHALRCEDSDDRATLASGALELFPNCSLETVSLFERLSEQELSRAKEVLELALETAATLVDPVSTLSLDTLPPSQIKFLDYDHLQSSRPYLNTKVALARCLWSTEKGESAVRHLWDALRLDSSDDRGIRFPLACWLFELHYDEELKRLTRMCLRTNARVGGTNNDTFFRYLQALTIFRKSGTKPNGALKFKRAVEELFEQNPYIAPYLLGRIPLPEKPPVIIYGSQRLEAEHYTHHCLTLWESVPGALKCLSETFDAWLKEFCTTRDDETFTAILQLPKDGISHSDNK